MTEFAEVKNKDKTVTDQMTNADANDREVLDNLRKQMWLLKHGYPDVSVYIKGICRPNPGPGAYGVILQFPSLQQVTSGYLPATTNNEAELTAAIAALGELATSHEVDLYSNSQWLIKTATGIYNRNRYPERWAELDRLAGPHIIEWHWVQHDPLIEQARIEANNQIAVNSVTVQEPQRQLSKSEKFLNDFFSRWSSGIR